MVRRFCLRCKASGEDIYVGTTRPHITCNDGTTLSVQVGTNLYCTPRNDEGPWTHVEVGFLSATPSDSWEEYADGGFPSDVYGYVPVAMVEEYIAMHGGRKTWT